MYMSLICHSSSSAIPTAAICSLASTAACRFGRGWNSGALVFNFAGIACSVLSHDNSSGNRCCTALSTDVPVRIFAPRTTPSIPRITFPTIPIFHLPRFFSSDLIITTSPTVGALDLLPCCWLWRSRSHLRYSFSIYAIPSPCSVGDVWLACQGLLVPLDDFLARVRRWTYCIKGNLELK